MKTRFKMMLLLLASMSLACARLVVLDPEAAAKENSRDWTINRAPQSPPPAVSPPPSTPQAPQTQ